jgi:hypothetical protein
MPFCTSDKSLNEGETIAMGQLTGSHNFYLVKDRAFVSTFCKRENSVATRKLTVKLNESVFVDHYGLTREHFLENADFRFMGNRHQR